MEVILADNQSPDGSAQLAEELADTLPFGRFIQHGENLGFSEGNNRAARDAKGTWLFFLNNDTWLEPDCLERLLAEVESFQAVGGSPLVLNYHDDSVQTYGADGFDVMGMFTIAGPHRQTRPALAWSGCSFLIRRDWFERLGGFDPVFFMYAEEWDLAWRLWLAGGTGVVVPSARLHHRSEANVNPGGGEVLSEYRTSHRKRFFSNRNNLLTVLKNAEGPLLITAAIQVFYLLFEGAVWSCLTRSGSLFFESYYCALRDCWRLRAYWMKERRRIQSLRRRSDWWMLRFFRFKLNRWIEVPKLFKMGLPKISKQA